MAQLDELNHLSLYGLMILGLTTGLLGSGHCLGMCGGVVTATTKNRREVSLYHIGRLIGYLSLGVLIPQLGLELSGVKENQNLKLYSALFIGLTFIFIGLKDFIKNRKRETMISKWYQETYKKLWQMIFSKFYNFNLLRSFSIGAMSALLPCGFLWVVLIMSLTTTSIFYAGAFITAFWLGTTPALSFAPLLIRKYIKPLQLKAPRLLSSTFILIGLFTISYRLYNFYYVIPEGMSCH